MKKIIMTFMIAVILMVLGFQTYAYGYYPSDYGTNAPKKTETEKTTATKTKTSTKKKSKTAGDDATPEITIDSSTGKITLKDNTVGSKEDAFATINTKYKSFIVFFSGIATLTFVVIFIKHFIELGMKASSPKERKEITSGLLWSGLAAAGLGSVTFVVALLFNLI